VKIGADVKDIFTSQEYLKTFQKACPDSRKVADLPQSPASQGFDSAQMRVLECGFTSGLDGFDHAKHEFRSADA
jgi:hypothetical protein